MEKVEAKVGFNVKKSFVEETLYMDRETQIKAIEKTFDDSKKEIKQHYRYDDGFTLVSATSILSLMFVFFF